MSDINSAADAATPIQSMTTEQRFAVSIAYEERFGDKGKVGAEKLRMARKYLPENKHEEFLNTMEDEKRDALFHSITGNDLGKLAAHSVKKSTPPAPMLELPENSTEAGIAPVVQSVFIPQPITNPAKMLLKKNPSNVSELPVAFAGVENPFIQDAEFEEIPAEPKTSLLPVHVSGTDMDDEAYDRMKREKEKDLADILKASEIIEADETLLGLDGKICKLTDHGRKMLPELFEIFLTDKTIPAELCNTVQEIEYRKHALPNDRGITEQDVRLARLGGCAVLKFDKGREIYVGQGFVGKPGCEKFDLQDARNSILSSIAAGWTKDKNGCPRRLNLAGPEKKKELMWVQAELLNVKTDFKPQPGSPAYKLLKIMRAKMAKGTTPEEMADFCSGVLEPKDGVQTEEPQTLKDTFTVEAGPKKAEEQPETVAEAAETPAVEKIVLAIHPKLDAILQQEMGRLKNTGETLDAQSDVAIGYWKLVTMFEYLASGAMKAETQQDIADKVTSFGGLKLHFEDQAISENDLTTLAKERRDIEIVRDSDARWFEKANEARPFEEKLENRVTRLLEDAAEVEISDTAARALRNLKTLYAAGMVEISSNETVTLENQLREGGSTAAHDFIHKKTEAGLKKRGQENFDRDMAHGAARAAANKSVLEGSAP